MDLTNENDDVRRKLVSELADAHYVLSSTEKQFLLCAERGDVASAQKIIDTNREKSEEFSIDCMDPLNRTALIIAIEKENIDLMEVLLNAGIQVKDALLHAIDEEYVEGVEMLLEWEEDHHVEGQPYSWEVSDRDSSTYTQDITPIILAAHKNNYEILKLLMDRGASLPIVHDIRCACDECTITCHQDSLRYSNSRMNVYKALTSPSLICLSSKDPLLTAIQLFGELKSLSQMEDEFKAEYAEMTEKVQTFASTLLDHLRTSKELEIILNYNPTGNPWEPGDEPSLERLKLAIKYKLKLFVAHPSIQQHLGSIWYKGLPGFKKGNIIQQFIGVSKIGTMFWLYCIFYMITPKSKNGQFIKLPFVKFICESASYMCFLGLLSMASQRIELYVLKLLATEMEWAELLVEEMTKKERGALPGLIETLIILYIISLIAKEIQTLYKDGLMDYMSDLWNTVDFFAFTLYALWIWLKLTAWFIVSQELSEGHNPWYPRHKWATFEPNLVSEGAFTAAMIISYLKLVHIFSINSHLGPLQISLGRMIIDIIKFLIIYTLVLFAFGCGLTQLLWYFAAQEESKCYPNNSQVPDFDNQDKACTIWRRFVNLFEASQSLFWASFGLVDLTAFDLTGIKSFTRFWALLIFGSYSVVNIIVLLNMLIAMMSNSYQIISERADSEWKYARSKLFINYFENTDSLPAPFNLMPTVEQAKKMFVNKEKSGSIMRQKTAARDKADLRYEIIMQMLIRRYVTSEQKKMEDFSITEDDIAEVRHDISTMRFEIIDIFRKNGYNVGKLRADENIALAKKDKIMERRILKDFQIGVIEGIVQNVIMSENEPQNIFGKIAKAIKRGESNKKDWNSIVRKSVKRANPIGSGSLKTERITRMKRSQKLRTYILEHGVQGAEQMDPDKLAEYNPNLSELNPTSRIAYAKFKMKLLKNEVDIIRTRTDSVDQIEKADDNERSKVSLKKLRRLSSIETINEQLERKEPAEQKPDNRQVEEDDDPSRGVASSSIRPRPSSGKFKKKISSIPGKLPTSIAEELLQDDQQSRPGPDMIAKSDDDRSKKETVDNDDDVGTKKCEKKPVDKTVRKIHDTTDKARDTEEKIKTVEEDKATGKKQPADTEEKHPMVYELKGVPQYLPGKGKSKVSGNVISGWI